MARRWKLLETSGSRKKRGLSAKKAEMGGLGCHVPPLQSPSPGLCSLGSSVSDRVTDGLGGVEGGDQRGCGLPFARLEAHNVKI